MTTDQMRAFRNKLQKRTGEMIYFQEKDPKISKAQQVAYIKKQYEVTSNIRYSGNERRFHFCAKEIMI